MYLGKIITTVVLAVAGLASANVLPVMEKRAGGNVCTSQYFEPITTVGNKAGTPFCESRWGTTYVPITTITTWSDSSYVYGLQVSYSDGSVSPIHGYTAANLQKMSISVSYASDNFTLLDIYQTAGYPYINSLLVTTKSGQIMNAGESVVFFPTGYVQAVGSGILFGVSGTINPSNGYLNSLGFQFLNGTIASVDVYDLKFTDLPSHDQDITPQRVDTATFTNNQSAGMQTWTFSNQHDVQISYEFQLAFTEAFKPMVAFEFDGGVPVVNGKSTVTFDWEISSTQTFSITYAVTDTLKWDEQGTIGPGQSVTCVAVYGEGVGNFPFNSTVRVNLKEGGSFTFEESGILKIDDSSNAQTLCSDNK